MIRLWRNLWETNSGNVTPTHEAISSHALFNNRDCLDNLASRVDKQTVAALASVNKSLSDGFRPMRDKMQEERAQRERSLCARQSIEDLVSGVSRTLEIYDPGALQVTYLDLEWIRLEEHHLKSIVDRFTDLVEIRFNTIRPMGFSLKPLQNLPQLKKLHIHGYDCRNGDVSSLSALEQLSVNGGHGSDERLQILKSELKNMTNLRELCFYGQQIDDLNFLGNLVLLEKIKISGFIGSNLPWDHLKNLKELEVANESGRVRGLELRADALINLKSLRLSVELGMFTNSQFDQIAQMTNLKRLDLESGETAWGLDHALDMSCKILSLQNLEALRLCNFIMDSHCFVHFSRLSKLQHLDIRGENHGTLLLPDLDMPQLKSLEVDSNKVGVNRLTGLSNLEFLRLNNLVVKKGSAVDLPKLKRIDVSGRYDSKPIAQRVRWNLPALESAQFGPAGAPGKFRTIKCLERYYACDPGDLNDLPNLRELAFVSYSQRPTRDQLNKLYNLKSLLKLELDSGVITADYVPVLNSLTGLRQLTIDPKMVSAEVWSQIRLPNLRILEFDYSFRCDKKLSMAHFPKLERIFGSGSDWKDIVDLSEAKKPVRCLPTLGAGYALAENRTRNR